MASNSVRDQILGPIFGHSPGSDPRVEFKVTSEADRVREGQCVGKIDGAARRAFV